MHNYYKQYVLKFLQKYLFIFKTVSDGWTVRYKNKDNVIIYNNIKDVDKKLLNSNNFIAHYKNYTLN